MQQDDINLVAASQVDQLGQVSQVAELSQVADEVDPAESKVSSELSGMSTL